MHPYLSFVVHPLEVSVGVVLCIQIVIRSIFGRWKYGSRSEWGSGAEKRVKWVRKEGVHFGLV
jgi:hypothetical protein